MARLHLREFKTANDYIATVKKKDYAGYQGKRGQACYLEKKIRYADHPHFRSYGIFDANEKLVAYCNIGIYGNDAATGSCWAIKINATSCLYY